MQDSRLPLRKWAFAIYLYVTNLKGVSSMKLHRDIKVTQKTAWFMLHRLREGWDASGLENFTGPVEVDETYFGGREANKHAKKKKRLGRGGVGKSVIAGAKDRATNRVRAKVVDATDARTLQRFVADHAAPSATVYTDEHSAYKGMPFKHSAVRHSAGEYVRLMGSTSTASNRSGRRSSARTRAFITRSATSTYSAMSTSSPGVTTSGLPIPSTRCRTSSLVRSGSG